MQKFTISSIKEIKIPPHEFYAALRIMTHLDITLYIISLWSDLSCAAELVIADSKLVTNISVDSSHLTLEHFSSLEAPDLKLFFLLFLLLLLSAKHL